MSKMGKSIYCGAIALVLFAMLRNYIEVSNMMFFVLMCGAFAVVTLLANVFLNKMNMKENHMAERIWTVLPVISLIVWIILFYINETDAGNPLDKELLIRSYFPFPLWITITTVGVVLCLWVLRKKPERTFKYQKTVRAIVAVLFTIGTSVQFYAPNIFQDILGGTYHSHAYTNSIINVCWLIPYSDNMEALYGHYAILFMPVLKVLHSLFGMDYLTGIFMVSAIVAGISILLFIWVLDYFAKDDLIFYLGMFAIGERYFMLMRGGVYLQVHPHRMIFPMILTALALLEYKKKKEYNLLAVCAIAFSIVWSTEVGLVTMLAFALYRWIQHIMDGENLTVKKCLLLVRELLIYALIPFVLSYIIVNGYNVLLAKGSWLNLEDFLFPLISESGYVGNIELPLPDVTHAWIGTAVLFLCPVGLMILSLFFPQKKRETKCFPFYFLLGVMSLGLMLYYINRPVEGSLFIIMFLMLIMQVIILQRAQDEYLEWKEKKESIWGKENRFLFLSLRVVTTLILFIMAFDSLYSMPGAWKTSRETIWKRAELLEFLERVYVQVPPDAVSFGEGVPEMLSMIDRDTHLHTTEWSYRNMPLDTMEHIRYNELEGEKWIFCALNSLWDMQDKYPGLTDNYELHDIFEYNGAQFGFFVRKE